MLDKIHSHLINQGLALLRSPLKATSFVLQCQVLEQFLGWQFQEIFNNFILIAARKEDPDALFFQRHLQVEGNTELGLHVKNLMDSIELESIPLIFRFGLLRLAEFIKAGQKEGVDQNDRALSSC
ncbi:ubiquinone anaerobic biosynthesis accessory factor UbiT [Xenorhabdus japonica]|uniref:Predicted lipid carrier protein YhbT, contains SCP2 domain n=1 Tax=Xenorhabdus japonica TaxID=53341 RepID=A0A1I4YC85_9GAMM|nr:SCP2 sterol-binding domain-containing protein [Xenorhabdus japonica]SFN35373.1 Predicted lipid carrier protein YhbT, contains SCP2 domain [Xenorhabdus japonica]